MNYKDVMSLGLKRGIPGGCSCKCILLEGYGFRNLYFLLPHIYSRGLLFHNPSLLSLSSSFFSFFHYCISLQPWLTPNGGNLPQLYRQEPPDLASFSFLFSSCLHPPLSFPIHSPSLHPSFLSPFFLSFILVRA